jgi:hypothetical protein
VITESGPCRNRETLVWRVAPFVCAAFIVAMILALPLFPSNDGPVHLYYVSVLHGLLTHTGPYAHEFEIKSYVTPYMLEYYSLLALETVFSPLLSEKLLICGYVVVFVLAFRCLMGAVTRSPGLWTLAGVPFCLNCYVYLGFLNYAFGTALALLLCGCWLRWREQLTARHIALLVGQFLFLLLTHPVPALVFLAFAGINVTVTVAYEWAGGAPRAMKALHRHSRHLGVIAAISACAGLWVLSFTGGAHAAGRVTGGPPATLLRTFTSELKFWTLAPLTAGGFRALWIAVAASAGIAVLIGLAKERGRIGPDAASIGAIAIVCLIARCVTPESANGSSYFAERFSIYWIAFLLVLAAALKPPRWSTVMVGAIALGAMPILLFFHWTYLSGAARGLAAAIDAQQLRAGSLGIVIADQCPADPGAVGNPFKWGSVHLFRTSNAILTNAPWMDLEIIMLRPKHLYPWAYLDPDLAPEKLLQAAAAAPTLDFAVGVDGEGPMTQEVIRRLDFHDFRRTPRLVFYSGGSRNRGGGF